MFVIGTAGHVDHGKSTLVYALTGMDPDRLAEEKLRGMTIDLGFAWLSLPSGRDISIVDVPGHERFVKNMLAGVGGIDAVLLVVAADEGVMPQTREHLAIVDLLAIGNGVVALTKRDLVDDDWYELVQEDVRRELTGTVLGGAPIVPVSSTVGGGLEALKSALDTALDGVTAREPAAALRLPVDRVFSLSGHGTVVTGTLMDGTIRVGDEVEVLPEGLRTRVRSLQTHRRRVVAATAGSRVAANLVGLDVEQLKRGDVLGAPGSLHPTTTMEVTLRLLASADKPLRSGDELMLYVGAAEIPSTVRLLDGASVAPGQTTLVQLRLSDATVARRGDRFIVRRPSPAETVGGGEILDPRARRGRRGRHSSAAEDARDEQGHVLDVLASRRLWSIADLANRLQQPEPLMKAPLAALKARGLAIVETDFAATSERWQGLESTVAGVLSTFHVSHPLRPGMPKEELRERLGVAPTLWPSVLRDLAGGGVLAEEGAQARLPSFQARLSPAQAQRVQDVLLALTAGGSSPPALSELIGEQAGDAALLSYMVERGDLVRLNEHIAFPRETYRSIVERLIAELQRGPMTVAQARDLLGVSRRYALALLEHLDARRVTRRNGDERTLLRLPDWLTPARPAS